MVEFWPLYLVIFWAIVWKINIQFVSQPDNVFRSTEVKILAEISRNFR